MTNRPVDTDEWDCWGNDVIDDDYDDEAPDADSYEMGPLPRFVLTLRELDLEPWTESEGTSEWNVVLNETGDGVRTRRLHGPPGREAEWSLVCGMFAGEAPNPKDAATAVRAALTQTATTRS